MKSKKELIKVGLLFAIIAVSWFFVFQAIAGIVKITTSGTTTWKINMPITDRWTNGLVGYWTFNGQDTNWSANTATDSSTNSNTGTMTNMSTTTSPAPGKIGQALEFDGVDDYVDAGEFDVIEGNTALTVETWISANDLSNNPSIVRKWKASEQTFSFSATSDGKLGFSVNDEDQTDGGKTRQTAVDAITLNKWIHIVGRWDTSIDPEIYIDGVNQSTTISGTDNEVSELDANTENLSIGARYNAGTPDLFFNGLIDEVRIYDRALSATEIAEHYRAGANRLVKTNMPVTDRWAQGLVGYWTFNGQDTDWSANTATDSSTNSNTGTMTNMSTTISPAPGIIGQALNFDGVDDHVKTANGNSVKGLSQLTVSLWFKTDVLDDNYRNFYSEHVGGSSEVRLAFRIWNDNKLHFGGRTSDLGSFVTWVDSTTSLNTDTWYHAVAVFDSVSDTHHIYINGVDQSNSVAENAFENTNPNVLPVIGADADGTIQFFNGLIDEVRIYSRALSATEILEQYQAGAGR